MIRDDFAGPGGWDEGLRLLERTDVIGVENDFDACMTAKAAGHDRYLGDVRGSYELFQDGIEGYISSAPCQPFSIAGSGMGSIYLNQLALAVSEVAQGATPSEAVDHLRYLDPRSELVLHPMTIIRDASPEWVALEQVPSVLPLWKVYEKELSLMGYNVATGNVLSEQYGVAQTRKRAILVAHRNRAVALPRPTHSRFYSRDRYRQDPGVLPWVDMATALERYVPGVEQRSNYSAGGAGTAEERGRTTRSLLEPSVTITGKGFQWAHEGRVIRRATAAEAGAIQSFPADYPWYGTKGSRLQQVGNAIPPLLAAAILRPLL